MKRAILFGFVSAMVLQAAGEVIQISAVKGEVRAPFVITNGAVCQVASGGGPANGGQAVYTFTITNAGQYALVAEVQAPKGTTNAVAVSIDQEPRLPGMIWDVPATTNGFARQPVLWRTNVNSGSIRPPSTWFDLGTGVHKLYIQGVSGGIQLRAFDLHSQPAPPGRPAPPTGLRVVGGQ